jgi:drug/metabolite transporter (DMT)-like permease
MLMAWIGFGDTIGWMDLAGMAIASVGVLLVLSRRRASTA